MAADPQSEPEYEPEHTEALRRERRSQLRSLLLLAGAVLLFLLLRARPLLLFHRGWWRP